MNKNIENQLYRILRIFNLIEEGAKKAQSCGEKTGINLYWGKELKQRIYDFKRDLDGLVKREELKGGEREIAFKFYDTCTAFCKDELRLKGLLNKYYAFDCDKLKEYTNYLSELHENYRLCNF